MQLLLPQAAAFLISSHRFGSHKSSPQEMRATSTSDDLNIQHLHQLLMEKKQELLDDPSKLNKYSPLSKYPKDNDLVSLASPVFVRGSW